MMVAAVMIRFIGISIALGAALLSAPTEADQPATVPRIGVLVTSVPSLEEGLRHGLLDLGYVEGKTIVIEWRRTEGTQEQLRSVAADLIRLRVDLIVAWGTPTARAALDSTRTVPIVFCVADPVASGIITSLAKPGGNATGVALLTPELTAKRVELFRQLVPRAQRIGYLRNPSNPIASRLFAEAQQAARALGVELVAVDARDTREVETALRALRDRRLDGLMVSGDTLFLKEGARIARAVRAAKLPTTFLTREDVQHGAVMSYGWSLKEVMRSTAGYVDKILKGVKPADLPVEQVSTYELVINLPMARELGLDVPQGLLLRADEVMR